MASTFTTFLNLEKPGAGDQPGAWGTTLNANFDAIDDAVDGTTPITPDINGGTIDGAVIGGASAAAGTFTNLTASGTITFSGATVASLGTIAGDIALNADGVVDIGTNGTRLGDVFADRLRADEAVIFTEAADHPLLPAPGVAQLWVSNDATQKLYFTDDAGADNEVLTSGSGSVLTDTAIATTDAWIFFDADDSDNPKQRLISSAISDLGLAVLGANTFTGTQDFNGQQVEAFLNKNVATVSGTLTTTAHSGNILETSGNVTVPTTAGFNCILIAGGAHTVTFNSTTSAAMAAGDIMTLFVQDGTTIHAVLTASADKVSFT